MEYVAILDGLITLIKELIARGKKTGELSDADAAALQAHARTAFDHYATPAPPPAGSR